MSDSDDSRYKIRRATMEEYTKLLREHVSDAMARRAAGHASSEPMDMWEAREGEKTAINRFIMPHAVERVYRASRLVAYNERHGAPHETWNQMPVSAIRTQQRALVVLNAGFGEVGIQCAMMYNYDVVLVVSDYKGTRAGKSKQTLRMTQNKGAVKSYSAILNAFANTHAPPYHLAYVAPAFYAVVVPSVGNHKKQAEESPRVFLTRDINAGNDLFEVNNPENVPVQECTVAVDVWFITEARGRSGPWIADYVKAQQFLHQSILPSSLFRQYKNTRLGELVVMGTGVEKVAPMVLEFFDMKAKKHSLLSKLSPIAPDDVDKMNDNIVHVLWTATKNEKTLFRAQSMDVQPTHQKIMLDMLEHIVANCDANTYKEETTDTLGSMLIFKPDLALEKRTYNAADVVFFLEAKLRRCSVPMRMGFRCTAERGRGEHAVYNLMRLLHDELDASGALSGGMDVLMHPDVYEALEVQKGWPVHREFRNASCSDDVRATTTPSYSAIVFSGRTYTPMLQRKSLEFSVRFSMWPFFKAMGYYMLLHPMLVALATQLKVYLHAYKTVKESALGKVFHEAIHKRGMDTYPMDLMFLLVNMNACCKPLPITPLHATSGPERLWSMMGNRVYGSQHLRMFQDKVLMLLEGVFEEETPLLSFVAWIVLMRTIVPVDAHHMVFVDHHADELLGYAFDSGLFAFVQKAAVDARFDESTVFFDDEANDRENDAAATEAATSSGQLVSRTLLPLFRFHVLVPDFESSNTQKRDIAKYRVDSVYRAIETAHKQVAWFVRSKLGYRKHLSPEEVINPGNRDIANEARGLFEGMKTNLSVGELARGLPHGYNHAWGRAIDDALLSAARGTGFRRNGFFFFVNNALWSFDQTVAFLRTLVTIVTTSLRNALLGLNTPEMSAEQRRYTGERRAHVMATIGKSLEAFRFFLMRDLDEYADSQVDRLEGGGGNRGSPSDRDVVDLRVTLDQNGLQSVRRVSAIALNQLPLDIRIHSNEDPRGEYVPASTLPLYEERVSHATADAMSFPYEYIAPGYTMDSIRGGVHDVKYSGLYAFHDVHDMLEEVINDIEQHALRRSRDSGSVRAQTSSAAPPAEEVTETSSVRNIVKRSASEILAHEMAESQGLWEEEDEEEDEEGMWMEEEDEGMWKEEEEEEEEMKYEEFDEEDDSSEPSTPLDVRVTHDEHHILSPIQDILKETRELHPANTVRVLTTGVSADGTTLRFSTMMVHPEELSGSVGPMSGDDRLVQQTHYAHEADVAEDDDSEREYRSPSMQIVEDTDSPDHMLVPITTRQGGDLPREAVEVQNVVDPSPEKNGVEARVILPSQAPTPPPSDIVVQTTTDVDRVFAATIRAASADAHSSDSVSKFNSEVKNNGRNVFAMMVTALMYGMSIPTYYTPFGASFPRVVMLAMSMLPPHYRLPKPLEYFVHTRIWDADLYNGEDGELLERYERHASDDLPLDQRETKHPKLCRYVPRRAIDMSEYTESVSNLNDVRIKPFKVETNLSHFTTAEKTRSKAFTFTYPDDLAATLAFYFTKMHRMIPIKALESGNFRREPLHETLIRLHTGLNAATKEIRKAVYYHEYGAETLFMDSTYMNESTLGRRASKNYIDMRESTTHRKSKFRLTVMVVSLLEKFYNPRERDMVLELSTNLDSGSSQCSSYMHTGIDSNDARSLVSIVHACADASAEEMQACDNSFRTPDARYAWWKEGYNQASSTRDGALCDDDDSDSGSPLSTYMRELEANVSPHLKIVLGVISLLPSNLQREWELQYAHARILVNTLLIGVGTCVAHAREYLSLGMGRDLNDMSARECAKMVKYIKEMEIMPLQIACKWCAGAYASLSDSASPCSSPASESASPSPPSSQMASPTSAHSSPPSQTASPALSPGQPASPAPSPLRPASPALSPGQPASPAPSPLRPASPALSPGQPASPAPSPLRPASPALSPGQPASPAPSPHRPSPPASTPPPAIQILNPTTRRPVLTIIDVCSSSEEEEEEAPAGGGSPVALHSEVTADSLSQVLVTHSAISTDGSDGSNAPGHESPDIGAQQDVADMTTAMIIDMSDSPSSAHTSPTGSQGEHAPAVTPQSEEEAELRRERQELSQGVREMVMISNELSSVAIPLNPSSMEVLERGEERSMTMLQSAALSQAHAAAAAAIRELDDPKELEDFIEGEDIEWPSSAGEDIQSSAPSQSSCEGESVPSATPEEGSEGHERPLCEDIAQDIAAMTPEEVCQPMPSASHSPEVGQPSGMEPGAIVEPTSSPGVEVDMDTDEVHPRAGDIIYGKYADMLGLDRQPFENTPEAIKAGMLFVTELFDAKMSLETTVDGIKNYVGKDLSPMKTAVARVAMALRDASVNNKGGTARRNAAAPRYLDDGLVFYLANFARFEYVSDSVFRYVAYTAIGIANHIRREERLATEREMSEGFAGRRVSEEFTVFGTPQGRVLYHLCNLLNAWHTQDNGRFTTVMTVGGSLGTLRGVLSKCKVYESAKRDEKNVKRLELAKEWADTQYRRYRNALDKVVDTLKSMYEIVHTTFAKNIERLREYWTAGHPQHYLEMLKDRLATAQERASALLERIGMERTSLGHAAPEHLTKLMERIRMWQRDVWDQKETHIDEMGAKMRRAQEERLELEERYAYSLVYAITDRYIAHEKNTVIANHANFMRLLAESITHVTSDNGEVGKKILKDIGTAAAASSEFNYEYVSVQILPMVDATERDMVNAFESQHVVRQQWIVYEFQNTMMEILNKSADAIDAHNSLQRMVEVLTTNLFVNEYRITGYLFQKIAARKQTQIALEQQLDANGNPRPALFPVYSGTDSEGLREHMERMFQNVYTRTAIRRVGYGYFLTEVTYRQSLAAISSPEKFMDELESEFNKLRSVTPSLMEEVVETETETKPEPEVQFESTPTSSPLESHAPPVSPVLSSPDVPSSSSSSSSSSSASSSSSSVSSRRSDWDTREETTTMQPRRLIDLMDVGSETAGVDEPATRPQEPAVQPQEPRLVEEPEREPRERPDVGSARELLRLIKNSVGCGITPAKVSERVKQLTMFRDAHLSIKQSRRAKRLQLHVLRKSVHTLLTTSSKTATGAQRMADLVVWDKYVQYLNGGAGSVNRIPGMSLLDRIALYVIEMNIPYFVDYKSFLEAHDGAEFAKWFGALEDILKNMNMDTTTHHMFYAHLLQEIKNMAKASVQEMQTVSDNQKKQYLKMIEEYNADMEGMTVQQRREMAFYFLDPDKGVPKSTRRDAKARQEIVKKLNDVLDRLPQSNQENTAGALLISMSNEMWTTAVSVYPHENPGACTRYMFYELSNILKRYKFAKSRVHDIQVIRQRMAYIRETRRLIDEALDTLILAFGAPYVGTLERHAGHVVACRYKSSPQTQRICAVPDPLKDGVDSTEEFSPDPNGLNKMDMSLIRTFRKQLALVKKLHPDASLYGVHKIIDDRILRIYHTTDYARLYIALAFVEQVMWLTQQSVSGVERLQDLVPFISTKRTKVSTMTFMEAVFEIIPFNEDEKMKNAINMASEMLKHTTSLAINQAFIGETTQTPISGLRRHYACRLLDSVKEHVWRNYIEGDPYLKEAWRFSASDFGGDGNDDQVMDFGISLTINRFLDQVVYPTVSAAAIHYVIRGVCASLYSLLLWMSPLTSDALIHAALPSSLRTLVSNINRAEASRMSKELKPIKSTAEAEKYMRRIVNAAAHVLANAKLLYSPRVLGEAAPSHVGRNQQLWDVVYRAAHSEVSKIFDVIRHVVMNSADDAMHSRTYAESTMMRAEENDIREERQRAFTNNFPTPEQMLHMLAEAREELSPSRSGRGGRRRRTEELGISSGGPVPMDVETHEPFTLTARRTHAGGVDATAVIDDTFRHGSTEGQAAAHQAALSGRAFPTEAMILTPLRDADGGVDVSGSLDMMAGLAGGNLRGRGDDVAESLYDINEELRRERTRATRSRITDVESVDRDIIRKFAPMAEDIGAIMRVMRSNTSSSPSSQALSVQLGTMNTQLMHMHAWTDMGKSLVSQLNARLGLMQRTLGEFQSRSISQKYYKNWLSRYNKLVNDGVEFDLMSTNVFMPRYTENNVHVVLKRVGCSGSGGPAPESMERIPVKELRMYAVNEIPAGTLIATVLGRVKLYGNASSNRDDCDDGHADVIVVAPGRRIPLAITQHGRTVPSEKVGITLAKPAEYGGAIRQVPLARHSYARSIGQAPREELPNCIYGFHPLITLVTYVMATRDIEPDEEILVEKPDFTWVTIENARKDLVAQSTTPSPDRLATEIIKQHANRPSAVQVSPTTPTDEQAGRRPRGSKRPRRPSDTTPYKPPRRRQKRS